MNNTHTHRHTHIHTRLQSSLDPGEGQEQAAIMLFDVVTCMGSLSGLRMDRSVSRGSVCEGLRISVCVCVCVSVRED